MVARLPRTEAMANEAGSVNKTTYFFLSFPFPLLLLPSPAPPPPPSLSLSVSVSVLLVFLHIPPFLFCPCNNNQA